MLDSFLTETLHLPLLPSYFPIFITSFLTCNFLNLVLSPILSSLLFPKTYSNLSPKHKFGWNIRFVAWVHSIIIVPPAAYYVFKVPLSFQVDPLFGIDHGMMICAAISSGYFAWDTLVSIIDWICYDAGFGFVIHGIGAGTVFMNCYRPFAQGYGGVFLLWEVSTLFLNPHWFMDKLSLTGSLPQMINGFFLVTSFFFTRIIFGYYQSVLLLLNLLDEYNKGRCGIVIVVAYAASNWALNLLNAYWLSQMIRALQSRFAPNDKKVKKLVDQKLPNGTLTKPGAGKGLNGAAEESKVKAE